MSDAKPAARQGLPELDKEIRVSDLMRSPVTAFELPLSEAALAEVAKHLSVVAVRKFRFEGEISSGLDFGLRLSAKLGATVTLRCVVTLKEFNQRIDTDVRRVFLEENKEDGVTGEIELAEDFDEDVEPISTHINIANIALEELSLNLPPFPRAPDANLDTVDFAPPGVAPLDDAASKPFAALAALKGKIQG